MAFKLRVEFSGPNLFLLHTAADGNTSEVTVLMPDARRITHPDPKHLDDERAVHHVGIVRLDLADVERVDMEPRFPRGEEGEPSYELVHRFRMQELTFGDGLEPEPMTELEELALPDLDVIAPGSSIFGVEPREGVLGDDPPKVLLMRTTLRGGTFLTKPKTEWELLPHMNPGGQPYRDHFVSTVAWQRDILDDHLDIAITSFDQAGTAPDQREPDTTIRLGPFPPDEVVTLAVGNLCADNPLDWNDLPPRPVPDRDEDFKWVYYLVHTRGKPTLDIPPGKLPFPRLVEVLDPETGDEACMGAKMTIPAT